MNDNECSWWWWWWLSLMMNINYIIIYCKVTLVWTDTFSKPFFRTLKKWWENKETVVGWMEDFQQYLSSYQQMTSSASNDNLLFNAARVGNLEEVKELLSKGTETEYRDAVCWLIILICYKCYILFKNIDYTINDWWWLCPYVKLA